MAHTAIILYGHIDPSFLQMCVKTQPPTKYTLCSIVMYGQATSQYATYTNLFILKYEITMSV